MLEPRVMYDGAAAATMDGLYDKADASSLDTHSDLPTAVPEAQTSHVTDGAEADASSATSTDALHADPGSAAPADLQPGDTVVFIDSQIANYQAIAGAITSGARVILFDGSREGIHEIAQELSGAHDLAAIDIISHGALDTVQLGTDKLTTETVSDHADDLAAIGNALATDGQIDLYGCNIAAAGDGFLRALKAATGRDIAASTDATGATALGGDWTLEVSTGVEAAALPADRSALESFNDLLLAATAPIKVLDSSTATFQNGATMAVNSVTINDVATDAAGDIFAVGTFRGTVYFGLNSGGTNVSLYSNDGNASGGGTASSVFIVKYNSAGVVQWAEELTGSTAANNAYGFQGNSIAVSSDGTKVVVGGTYINTIDLDPGAGTVNVTNTQSNFAGFVVELNGSGAYQWNAHLTGPNTVAEVAIDASGNVYAAGNYDTHTNGTKLIDSSGASTTLAGSNQGNVYVVKLTAGGTTSWVAPVVTTAGQDYVHALAVDGSGNVYFAGQYATSTFGALGSKSGGAGGYSEFFAKLNSSGTFQWVDSIEGSSGSNFGAVINDIAFTSNGPVVVGTFGNGAKLVPGSSTTQSLPTWTSYSSTVSATHVFVEQFDSSGTSKWLATESATGISSDSGNHIAVDAAGNVVVTGVLVKGAYDGYVPAGQTAATTATFGSTSVGYSSVIVNYGSYSTYQSEAFIWVMTPGTSSYTSVFAGVMPGSGAVTDGGVGAMPGNGVALLLNMIGTVDANPGSGVSTVGTSGYDGGALSLLTNADLGEVPSTTISVNDVSQSEGNGGQTAYSFTVSLSAAATSAVTVHYATADGTATTADGDYTATSGDLTFGVGETTKTVTVYASGDTKFETSEAFTLVLSAATGATIADGSGAGTISNDDSQPTISINDVTKAEGAAGVTSFTFTVSLSNPSYQAVNVNYATVDGTAIAGDDYAAVSGGLLFAPGQTTKTVTVLVIGDPTFEPTEDFNVVLSTPTNAVIADNIGIGTITNDDHTAPTVAVDNAVDYNEQATITLDNGLTLGDVDSATLTGATISISDFRSGDTLGVALGSGITVASNSGGVLVLTGTASVTDYQTVLRSVTFNNTGDDPSFGNSDNTRTVNWTVTDDTSLTSATATEGVFIHAINDAPTIVKPGSASVAEDADIVFSVAGGNQIAISDVDGTTAQVTLTVGRGTLTLATTSGLTFSGGGDGTSSMTITGTLAAINTALDGLRFRNVANDSGSVTLQVVVDDLGNTGTPGALTSTQTLPITVTAVNDAPVATIVPASYAATEQTSLTLSGTGLSVSDIDVELAPSTVTLSVTEGTLTAIAGSTGVTIASGNGTSSLQVTGNLGQINNFLNGAGGSSLSYIDNTDTPAASATLTLTVNDNGNFGAGGPLTGSDTATITIAAANDAPTISAPGAQTVNEDSALVFSSGNSNSIAISDIDANGGNESVMLSVAHGTLTLGSLAGVSFAGGANNTSSMTVTGTLAAINTALAGLRYTGTANYNGPDTLSISVNDLGNTGLGGALSASGSIAITVSPVDDAPVFEGALAGGSASATFAENTAVSTATPNGTQIFDVAANNGDGGATDSGLTYSISAGNRDVDNDGTAAFAIDAATGKITVADADDLDAEAGAFALTILASDGALSTTATLNVGLGDLAETFTVTTLADETDNGGGLAAELADGGGLSLREAIGLANRGSGSADTIVFDVSLSGSTIRLTNPAGALRITGPLTIKGDVDGNDSPDITITGDVNGNDTLLTGGITDIFTTSTANLTDNVAIMYSTIGTNLTLDGLVLTGGVTSGNGGAVNAGADLVLTHSIVSGNQSNNGGGALSVLGNATLTDITLSGNRSTNDVGGGILVVNGDLTLTDSTVSNNSAHIDGGGVATAEPGSSVTIVGSTISGNLATGSGGGLSLAGTAEITNSTISGNAAGDGGGGLFANSFTLTNVTVSGNRAGLGGGGVFGNAGVATINNSTITGNDGGTGGGGVDIDSGTIANSIIFGNAGGAEVFAVGGFILSGNNIIGTDVLSGSSDVGDTTLADVFASVANNSSTGVLSGVLANNGGPVATVLIKSGGAAHNGGNAAVLPADSGDADRDTNTTETLPVDARGQVRVFDAKVDIGAVELQQGVNDVPVNAVPAAQTINEDTNLVFSTANGNAISITDSDIGSGSASVTLSVANGVLTLSQTTGLAFATGDGTGDPTMTFTGSLADINAALTGLTYRGNLNFNGGDTLTLTVDDQGNSGAGGAKSDTDTVAITVSAVNDAPTIPTVPTSVFGLPGDPVILGGTGANAIVLSDVDAGNNTVGVILSSTQGHIFFLGTDYGNHVVFTSSIANFNAAFASGQFTYVSSVNDTIRLSFTDIGSTGAGGALLADADIAVTIDQPPVVTADANAAYTENAGSPTVLSPNLTLIDTDAPGSGDQINSATVEITGGAFAGDVLAAAVTGNISAAYNSATHTLTLSGADTIANYLAVLRSVTFASTSDNPTDYGASTSRTITWSVTDNYDVASLPASTIVNIAAINDAPSLTAGSGAAYTEQAPAVTIDATIAIGDVDSLTLAGASVTIGGFVTGDALNFVDQNGISGSYNATTGVLTLSGTASLADYQAALRSVTFASTSDNPTAFGTSPTRTVSWQVNDGSGSQNLSNRPISTINVTAVNDTAVISGTSTGAVTEAGGVSNGTPNTPTTTGTLTDTDVDNAANSFTAVAAGAATTNGYGTFAMTAGGAWTYTIDENNGAVQALNVGDTLTDTFSVTSIDGTAQIVTITINGANDAAIISGTSTGAVTEAGGVSNGTPNTPTATGTLTDTDVDNAANSFAAVAAGAASANGYGTFAMTAGGTWTYTIDENNTAVQALNVGETLTDTFSVTTVDGTAQIVTVTINGANDAAIVSGTTTGAVTEAGGVSNGTPNTPTATGTLTDTDVDNTPNSFTAVAAGAATTNGYGTFAMTAGGAWTYTIDENNAAVQALNVGDTLTDTFSVTTVDGTAQIVTITINGANDAAIISGTSTGAVTEAGGVANGTPNTPTATGTLTDTDVDNAANSFTAVAAGAATTNGYGTFEIGKGGTWTYTIDENNAAVQALNVGETLTDTFSVTTVDGTAQIVTITINGANDAAIVSGTTTGAVTEAGGVANGTPNTPAATGTLTDTDVDNAANSFTAVAAGATTTNGYGTFAMTAGGAWTYTIDEANAAVQALNVGDTLTDTFSVTTVDGTAQIVTVTINGANDAAVVASGNVTSFDVNDGGGVAINPTIGITDVDGTSLTGATVQISSGLEIGDALKFTNQSGITGTYNSATGTLTLTGTASIADYQVALASVAFTSTTQVTSARTITWIVNDTGPGATASAGATSTINVRGAIVPALQHDQSVEGDQSGSSPGGNRSFFDRVIANFSELNRPGFAAGSSIFFVQNTVTEVFSPDLSFVAQVSLDGLAAPLGGDVVAVVATLADGSKLPDWLKFDPKTGILSGQPPSELVAEIIANRGNDTETAALPGASPSESGVPNGIVVQIMAIDASGNLAITSVTLKIADDSKPADGLQGAIAPLQHLPAEAAHGSVMADTSIWLSRLIASQANRNAVGDAGAPGHAGLSEQFQGHGWREMHAARDALLASLSAA